MNIVFLDIDGVLQPYDAEFRFLNLDRRIIEKLSIKYKTDYSRYGFFDVSSTYYDWDEQAVCRLKYILDKTSSKIIVSSDWRRSNEIYKMRDLLKIQGLDSYWFSDNIIMNKELEPDKSVRRAKEIEDSLNKYKIDNYVILDDDKGLEPFYPNNVVITNNMISIDNMNESIRILCRKK